VSSPDERLDQLRRIADEVLFPAALEVDRTGEVPASHWGRLAAEGFYGLAAPAELGGPGLELPEIVEGIEVMAGGCLATAFTWFQHHGVVFATSFTGNADLRAELFDDLVAGRTKAGVAIAGVLAEPVRMHAARVDGGWTFTGDAPFVSGWGIVDILQVSGLDPDSGEVISGIVRAEEQPGITSVDRMALVAADATNTVRLKVDGLEVPDERVLGRTPLPQVLESQVFGVRLNGAVPLGLVRRCVRLLEEIDHHDAAARLGQQCDDVRGRLDASMGDLPTMLDARADAAELAVRASSALVAAVGGAALTRSAHAQRLAREATFTLVASSRPAMRHTLVKRLSGG
jgi:alkylation response protein AidB-like acyl-CoA dehydrogenase